MSYNLLFVSIAFPPKNDPECLQTGRYFKYLSADSDFSIDVLTSRSPTLYMPLDDTLKKNDAGYCNKIELPIWENKLSNYVLRKLGFGRYLFPDSRMTFFWQWKAALKKLRVKPDLIYSRSNPMSSAFMAQHIKRAIGCPWVMHMSDPWALSPLHSFGRDHDRVLRAERDLLTTADATTFTSGKTLDLYAQCYPELARKFFTMPNVFDSEEIRPSVVSSEKKLTFVYTGGITAGRNVTFLQPVLEELRLLEPGALNEVQFLFAGDVDRTNRSFFYTGNPAVKHLGIISFADAQKLYDKAHVLMVVDNPTSERDAVFFPSKILDYFLTRKKILAITPEGSTTRDVLRGYNHTSFIRDEIQPMAFFLRDCLKAWRAGDQRFFFTDEIPGSFEAGTNAIRLSQLLKSVIKAAN